MKKRKYTKIQILEPAIVSMQEAGKTHREIAEHFGLERSQVKKCLERRRNRRRKQAAGIQPKPKGRLRKDGQPPHQSENAELKRLRMENQLLRDFLELSERGACVSAENFFSILKTEYICWQKIATFRQTKALIDDFIYFTIMSASS